MAGLVAAAGEARSEEVVVFNNGNKLLGYCNSGNALEQGLYLGFVAGAADALAAAKLMTDVGAFGGWRACLPRGVTDGQAETAP